MYGAYDTIDDRPALRFERRLAHPVDVVRRTAGLAGPVRGVPASRNAGGRPDPGRVMTPQTRTRRRKLRSPSARKNAVNAIRTG